MTEKEAELNPFREMDSVMMTAGGFISPAREGRLPDALRPAVSALATTSLQHDLATKIMDDNKELVIHSSHKGGTMTMPGTSEKVPLQQQSSSTLNPKILQRSGSNVPLIDIFLKR